ncbi:hypothetical protein B0A67_21635 [Flavobacterium aquidurense]|nr:hypothetical protein B0A67_21635 [Flavobacterium aquidurense]
MFEKYVVHGANCLMIILNKCKVFIFSAFLWLLQVAGLSCIVPGQYCCFKLLTNNSKSFFKRKFSAILKIH